ncbi:3-hydroxyisobutyrate dehydrogenase-like beta-hydroxyacid dehydrogenase [Nocardia transvalensis]|uniref:3-hydroxyisobutyrate dehydrogenase-like beta-hydroxyacid dehydrogenase n=1 Tax=Nocardia transvalensis TaxID=37333 RepID=A0A7W9ULY3_9NOCA|nr:NAD(P)-binding domain-containing protein [Nocardia transvalensis]MBB5918033.1 3-hydroxyisobutyrate dehydrogenase-like beta-hydroxyacid dehydrogenase [Nocardia transvalensis]
MTETPVTVLGLGAMGSALAAAFLKAGHPTTVWNRSPGKDIDLVAAGATRAGSVREAVGAGGLVVAVLLDHASVHETLDPIAGELGGRALVNLTSTAPEDARELARWAAGHGIDYLDGGIMATPGMIGQPGSSILYSGSRAVFDAHRPALELLGAAEYFGDDAGLASLYDFALLAGMYIMFAGFQHGAAMVRSAGGSAEAFGERAGRWLSAIMPSLTAEGRVIDSGDYSRPVQDLRFTKAALDAIVRASRDAGVALDVIGPVKGLVDRQIADGHGAQATERMFEGLV